jgi:hypothetical protein
MGSVGVLVELSHAHTATTIHVQAAEGANIAIGSCHQIITEITQ